MAYSVVATHQGSDSWAQHHLVSESADLDPALGDLLVWIAADHGLSTTLIQAVTEALGTP
jgi:hypothetical protein